MNVVLTVLYCQLLCTIINTLIGTAVVLFTDSYIGDLRREFDTQPNTTQSYVYVLLFRVIRGIFQDGPRSTPVAHLPVLLLLFVVFSALACSRPPLQLFNSVAT